MNDSHWAELGLTAEVLATLYRRGRQYAATHIGLEHQEDAVQDGMWEVLKVVACPPDNYPGDPKDRLDYLTKALYNEAMKRITRKTPPDTNIPIEQTHNCAHKRV